MKVLILYFSGTGNTHFIAEEIYKGLINNNIDTNISSVEDFKPEHTNDFDILLFGFPIYACDMPIFLEDYISRLSITKLKGVYLFSTLGFYGGNSLKKVGNRFASKGFTVLGGQEVKMPGSDGLSFSKRDSKFVTKALTKDYSKLDEVENIISKLANISRDINDTKNDSDILYNDIGIKTKMISKLMDPLFMLFLKTMEKLFKRKLWADSKCVKCGICEKICPSKNITVTEDRVIFSDKCYLCLRCVHQCPKEAIQIGKMTVDKFRWKGPTGEFNPMKH